MITTVPKFDKIKGDKVIVHYIGYLPDGSVFEVVNETDPLVIPVDKGFQNSCLEAIGKNIWLGEGARFRCAGYFGVPEKGGPEFLPSGIDLEFDVDCVGLEKPELGEYGDELPGEQSYLPPRDDL